MGKILKERRKALMMTQLDASEFCNYSWNVIGYIERGEPKYSMTALLNYAESLGYDIDFTLVKREEM